MAKKPIDDAAEVATSTPTRMPAAKRLLRFGPPDELAGELGVQFASADHIQGVVATDHIPTLMNAFQVEVRNGMTLPFQHIVKQHGEFGSLRIEPSGLHTVDDALVVGHQWSYNKDQPGHLAQSM